MRCSASRDLGPQALLRVRDLGPQALLRVRDLGPQALLRRLQILPGRDSWQDLFDPVDPAFEILGALLQLQRFRLHAALLALLTAAAA